MTFNGPFDACFRYARSFSSVDAPMRVRRRCAVVRNEHDSKIDDEKIMTFGASMTVLIRPSAAV
jgi:hypothetical protein